ncbi:MAG: hypothetical protein JSV03_14960 [Planctomycetota bacterium]|nr:MAG: hypothetical protein JSV03_14960 [Planctomycetota bacterium]
MERDSVKIDFNIRLPIAAFLGWLLPGAGHLFIGERTRGLIFMVTIALTFWCGVAIGGVKNTVNPVQRSWWFLGQICAGSHTVVVLYWSRHMENPPDAEKARLIAYGRSEEVSVVYTGICGLLNILIILDLLVRVEKHPEVLSQRGPPSKTKKAST